MALTGTKTSNQTTQRSGPGAPTQHDIWGSTAYESKGKQKLAAQEINTVIPVTPKYLKWSEAPITFDRLDHPENIPHLGRYPLVLDPIVRTVKLNRVLIDGGNGLNILFAKTLDDMKIPRSELNRSNSPFHGLIPKTSAIPFGQITLPMTLSTRKTFGPRAYPSR